MSDEHSALSIVPAKTDRDVAEELRARLRPLLEQVCAIISDANAMGIEVGFQFVRSPLGRNVVQEIQVKRAL